MHRFHHCTALATGGNVRLVGNDYDQKAGLAKGQYRPFDPGKKFELIGGRWRIWLAVAYDSTIDDPVTVEEYGWFQISLFTLNGRPAFTTLLRFAAGSDVIQGNATLPPEMPPCAE